LLEKGAYSSLRDYNGQTALHLAAKRGDFQVVKLLLDYATEVDVDDFSGRRPLQLAVEQGHESVVRLMLLRGVDAHAPVGSSACFQN
jgi:ankyrin repeat protein